MKGIIWYKTKQKGLDKFDELINNYAKVNIGVLAIKNNHSETYVRFLNDDIWRVVPATDQSRGHACNIALIDSNIDEEIVYTVIMPTVKSYSYRAYNFY